MSKRIITTHSQSTGNASRRRKVHLDGVGDILLERSHRAKRVNLSVRPFKGVRVAVPEGVSYQEAFEVAQAHTRWIIKQLAQMQLLERQSKVLERPVFVNRAVAKKVIVQRLAELAQQHGFTYNRVFVRNQKTRWGSCSAKNNINLNLHLVRLPAHLMDYVILHELVHTRIKNHSPAYWQALEAVMPYARCMDRELNQYEALLAAEA